MGKVPDMIPVFAGRPGNGDCPGLVIKEPLIKTKSKPDIPSRAKAIADFAALAARLKSCPDTSCNTE
jgi:hypothetical protein